MRFFIQTDNYLMQAPPEGEVYVYLKETSWDDHSFRTSYRLTILKQGYKQRTGNIRIGRLGQETGAEHVLIDNLGQDSFSHLPKEFCSVSHDQALYLALFESLTAVERREFAESLNLILGEDSPLYEAFKDDSCFKTSLLREGALDCSVILRGRAWVESNGTFYNPFKNKINIRLKGYSEFDLDFSRIEGINKHPIVAFIGKNGSGKSTAMYKIAKLFYSSQERRAQMLDTVGTINPQDMVMSRLILLSYSAFDNFVMPAYSTDQSFVYCGIRNLYKESESRKEGQEVSYQDDRQGGPICLKSNEDLARDLHSYIRESTRLNKDLLSRILLRIENEDQDAFQEYQMLMIMHDPYGNALWLEQDAINAFSSLSTGYKFFFHALFGIMANIVDYSVVMFDEPENHIHPPLLTLMLSLIGEIAHENNSIVLVATHSPLVLQETFSRHVLVVRKEDEGCTVSHPLIETYGENVGIINREVFDMTSENYDFYKTIDEYYEFKDCRKKETLEQVLDEFKEIFPSGISMQALLHINGLFNRNK